MITKISKIKRFGLFKDFDWDSVILDKQNDVYEFDKINILYGQNYSGKTTLSRMVQCLAEGHEVYGYSDAEFSICCGGNVEDQNSVEKAGYDVRVYNWDFIQENLAFLKDDKGDVASFAIIGAGNVKTEKEIEAIRKLIGDQGCGLKKELADAEREKSEKEKELARYRIDKEMGEKAREIKNNGMRFNKGGYHKGALKLALDKMEKEGVPNISNNDVVRYEKILGESHKDNIEDFAERIPRYTELKKEAWSIIGTQVVLTDEIKKMFTSGEQQDWAKNGMKLHEGATHCIFCGGEITEERWDRLNAFFNDEFSTLISRIDSCIIDTEEELKRFSAFTKYNKNQFYSELSSEAMRIQDDLVATYDEYCDAIRKGILKRLKLKRKDPFSIRIGPDPVVKDVALVEAQKNLAEIIERNNNITGELENKKSKAQKVLLAHEIARFYEECKYPETKAKIDCCIKEQNKMDKDIQDKINEIRKKYAEIKRLEKSLTDESEAAKKVTEYLGFFFGPNKITIEPINEESGVRFIILRDGEEAKRLSEGERSLVAFCYFMARLYDLNTDSPRGIIWIDDPISSLDSNHIFFVFSLIQSLIVEEKGFEQLFVSTHNLNFLKYLLTVSKGVKTFLVQRSGEKSQLAPMPAHFRNHITEINYLFAKVYECAFPESHSCFSYYDLGNCLRRFLEAYLFFRYPDKSDYKSKLDRFFNDDQKLKCKMYRLTNEYSHLSESIYRCTCPLDVFEMQIIAKGVLMKIKTYDEEQYKSFCKSINVNSKRPNCEYCN